jgi:hypothetical protein
LASSGGKLAAAAGRFESSVWPAPAAIVVQVPGARFLHHVAAGPAGEGAGAGPGGVGAGGVGAGGVGAGGVGAGGVGAVGGGAGVGAGGVGAGGGSAPVGGSKACTSASLQPED